MIESAELTVYDENGDSLSIDLSPVQLTAVCKILGLSMENGELMCFSNESIIKIMAKTIDRWEPKE